MWSKHERYVGGVAVEEAWFITEDIEIPLAILAFTGIILSLPGSDQETAFPNFPACH